MSFEFFAIFSDPLWYAANLPRIKKEIGRLKTFCSQAGTECHLLGIENRDTPDRWMYDVRLILKGDARILMEISAHPPSIEHDLSAWLAWLRSETDISVEDEDGQPTGW